MSPSLFLPGARLTYILYIAYTTIAGSRASSASWRCCAESRGPRRPVPERRGRSSPVRAAEPSTRIAAPSYMVYTLYSTHTLRSVSKGERERGTAVAVAERLAFLLRLDVRERAAARMDYTC